MTKMQYTPGDLVDHIAISAVIKDGDGKVLMFKHKKFGFWTIPIGKAEPNETAFQGMCTELKEECGIIVMKATEVATRPYTYERNGKHIHLIHHLFIIENYEGALRNNEPKKHLEMKFMEEEEISSITDLSDATLLYLETLGIATTQLAK